MAKTMQFLTFFIIIKINYKSEYIPQFFVSQGLFFFSFLNNPIK